MLERCEFCELNEEVLRECGGFSCKDGDITEFFTKEYADYAYQLLGKSYCFVEQDELLDAIKSWFIEPLNKTGCRYVVVDALNRPKVFDFYLRNDSFFNYPLQR